MPGIPLLHFLSADANLTADKERLRAEFIMHGLQDSNNSSIGLQDRILEQLEANGHASQIRHAAFAVAERISFASFLDGLPASTLSIDYRDQLDDVNGESEAHPGLVEAREHLHAFACQRLKELQILTHMPLVRPARTREQLSQLRRDLGPQDSPWTLLGEKGEEALALPSLPSMVRRDIIGPMEFLLALAGQMGRDPPGQNTTAGSRPDTSSAGKGGGLPWSLGLITFLPALRTVQVPGLTSLRTFFQDLRPQHQHVGLDDRQFPLFKEMKLHAASALLEDRSSPMCRSFLRFGCPQGARPKMWEAALCLSPLRPRDIEVFASLCTSAISQPALLDVAALGDMASVSDSEHFFLFEDMLRSVMLAFYRERVVEGCTSAEQQPGASSVMASVGLSMGISFKSNSGEAVDNGRDSDSASVGLHCMQQPYGALPVRGLATLAAPLCYLMEHPAAVHRLFRSFYCRHWCKLHSLTVQKAEYRPALPGLLKIYEQLLQELDPEVVAHLHNLGLPVTAIVLPWVCSAFSGHLKTEEVLLLWDRILGLDSLLPLPLLAVAIMCFRRQVILSCTSSPEVLEAMSDISQLQTVPLLQAVLFQG